jgi:PKD repeat protein
MKRMFLFILCAVVCHILGVAQQITKGEYFFDTDPGQGQGTALNITGADTITTVAAVTVPANMSPGLHYLYVRVSGNDNVWSQPESYLLYVHRHQAPLQAMEYFFDNDPGQGNGTAFSFSMTDTLNWSQLITVPALSAGQHHLYVRARDADGVWGMPEQHTIQICSSYGPLSGFTTYVSGQDMYFTDTSSLSVSRKWNFGDHSPEDTAANPRHQYTAPGIYNVQLISTNDCGSDTLTRAVTVAGIQSLYPATASQNGVYAGHVKGAGFSAASIAWLSLNGTDSIPATKTIFIDATDLKLVFRFTGTALGHYTLFVKDPVTGTVQLLNALKMEPEKPHDTWISLEGRKEILVNRWNRFKVVYGNNGNKTAVGIPIHIQVPGNVEARLTSPTDDTDLPIEWLTFVPDHFYIVKDSITNDSVRFAFLLAPGLEPGKTGELLIELRATAAGATTIPVLLQTGDPFYADSSIAVARMNGRMAGGPCAVPPAIQCLMDLITTVPIPNPLACGVGLINSTCGIINISADDKNSQKPYDIVGQVGGAMLNCLNVPGSVVSSLGKINWGTVGLESLKNLAGSAGGAFGFADGPCALILKYPNWDSLRKRFSADPNIKSGPTGHRSGNFVPAQYPFTYTIEFENLATATAPASYVLIKDDLDTSKFDMTTFRFNSFGFADTSFTVRTAGNYFERDIDLRPGKDAILRVIGKLDSLNKLRFEFITFDPATMQLTEDFMQGFLNPNINGTEGAGYISFDITPKTTLPTGTAIFNQATIIFDENAPIITNNHRTGIDKEKPVSQVLPVNTKLNDSTWLVKWTGNDTHAGVNYYYMYMSTNDSDYVIVDRMDALQMPIVLKTGNTYKFYSRAKDLVGNMEDAPGVPDQVFAISLPLTWLTFTVTKQNWQVLLAWSTASEQNNTGFEVQRSADGISYSTIGWVTGAGTTSHTTDYSFIDPQPVAGSNYYRLKQVDVNGTFSYSSVRKVEFDAIVDVVLQPNPATSNITVRINQGVVRRIKIMDAAGRMVWEANGFNQGMLSIPIDQYSKGIYFIEIMDSNNNRIIRKLVKE